MAVSFGKVLTKIFGSRNERLLKRYRRIVEQVNELEPKVQAMTDDAAPRPHRRSCATGSTRRRSCASSDVLPEAFAIIRESMDRHIGIREIFNPEQNFDPDKLDDEMLEAYDSVQRQMIATGESWQSVADPARSSTPPSASSTPRSRPPFRARPFDVQIIGGLVLYEGKIAEMATGEGKTFVAPLACFLRVLEGHPLPRRDGERLPRPPRRDWVRPAFENLGHHRRLHPVRHGARRRRRAASSTSATSPTAPTASSASTTCATT